MQNYLSTTGSIVHSQAFESGLRKVLGRHEAALLEREKKALLILKCTDVEGYDEAEEENKTYMLSDLRPRGKGYLRGSLHILTALFYRPLTTPSSVFLAVVAMF